MNNYAKISQHDKVYKTILNQSPFLEAANGSLSKKQVLLQPVEAPRVNLQAP